ncbi:hypothetical protein [Knoellia koreensis]|uniref:Uncharacterized protein n=1 Tax=Knoellia koreensis TaxID=2730921 RepID=A0A849HFP4_9MICO|nr:hypothetical protein [Knoellia sp. DB2414S]NNM45051.1 hypothetical protein [Knoellia sp. DB2414S]
MNAGATRPGGSRSLAVDHPSAPPVDAGHPLPDDLSFADALALAIERAGVSLSTLQRALAEIGHPVSLATLSHWRSGTARPERQASLLALDRLELLLRLPRGDLYRRLGPSTRVGPRAEADMGALDPHGRDLLTVRMDVGCPPPTELARLVHQAIVTVDGDGLMRSIHQRAVFRALGPVSAMPVVVSLERPQGDHVITALTGCRVGRVSSRPEDETFAAELVLDRPLERSDTAVLEFRIDLARHVSEHVVRHIAARRIRECSIQVNFDPQRPPAAVEEFSEYKGRKVRRAVQLDERARVHHVVSDFGPGLVGVAWQPEGCGLP